METVIDLKDLLKHEIMDLYSAEEQIIEALPLMIEKAGNDKLKTALRDHLKVTKDQKTRLDEIKKLMGEAPSENSADGEKPGFFSRLFGSNGEKCKGMEGLITEGKKMMAADMSPEAADAAIIASAQKIEHYEISGYGTARAFARELKLNDVVTRLEQTLNEEYQADDLLTQLAVGKVNIDAEFADGSMNGKGSAKSSAANSRSNGKSAPAKKTAGSTRSNGSITKSSSSKSPSKSPSSKGAGSSGRKVSPVKQSSSGKGNSSSKTISSSKGGSSSRGNSAGKSNSKAALKTKSATKKGTAKSSKGSGNKSSAKAQSGRKR